MKQSKKTELIGQVLLTLFSEDDIVWQNGPPKQVQSYPYLHCQQVRTAANDETLAGGSKIEEGYFLLTVVDDVDDHATRAEDKADLIAGAFVYGAQFLDGVGGYIRIQKPSEVLTGYRDGSSFRVPVKVSYHSAG